MVGATKRRCKATFPWILSVAGERMMEGGKWEGKRFDWKGMYRQGMRRKGGKEEAILKTVAFFSSRFESMGSWSMGLVDHGVLDGDGEVALHIVVRPCVCISSVFSSL
ncbi:hypothetical protein L6452_27165 [Arctium lappa]|uniref:Uncharacterized protein n=1 Tax=Arctium lappa TaxID=4217 RepID=A0ACB8ZX96_ARCLA|nr:hypothetical protein L6452_27165 [Arctium lappa]